MHVRSHHPALAAIPDEACTDPTKDRCARYDHHSMPERHVTDIAVLRTNWCALSGRHQRAVGDTSKNIMIANSERKHTYSRRLVLRKPACLRAGERHGLVALMGLSHNFP